MDNENRALADGDECVVVAGRHKGKTGVVRDLNRSKSGHDTITVVQDSGIKFKTLARSAALKA